MTDDSWDRNGPVVVVSRSAVTAAGMAAALGAAGWTVVRSHTGADPGQETPAWSGAGEHVVLVADETGLLPDLLIDALVDGARHVIAVGGRRAASALLAAVHAGANVVVDADQSLQAQVRALDRELVSAFSPAGRTAAVALLGPRIRDADLLASLTAREAEVLHALSRGETAADIAAGQVVSMSTVRTHIRAVLRKLEVTSQLAAVALAHRAGTESRQS